MLRSGRLLALRRQGLLRSSFHFMSHLTETSNMTTRSNSQSTAIGLTPTGQAALLAARRQSGEFGMGPCAKLTKTQRSQRKESVFLCDLCVLVSLAQNPCLRPTGAQADLVGTAPHSGH